MDRELQDEVIRYLAEAGKRRPAPTAIPLASPEAEKAERFARFLARRYYRDRLHRSFRYSRQVSGRAADDVVDAAAFDDFLGGCVLGSLEAAQQVGAMALAFLGTAALSIEWWGDLLQYENAYFLQAATSERGGVRTAPAPGISAACLDFEWDMPDLVARLRQRTMEGARRRGVTLAFSRTETGRIYVAEVDATTADVFRSVDGCRNLEGIAAAAGVSAERAQPILAELAAIGAVQVPR